MNGKQFNKIHLEQSEHDRIIQTLGNRQNVRILEGPWVKAMPLLQGIIPLFLCREVNSGQEINRGAIPEKGMGEQSFSLSRVEIVCSRLKIWSNMDWNLRNGEIILVNIYR